MKGAALRRSRDDIVDDIIAALRRLKPDAGNPGGGIRTHMTLVGQLTAAWFSTDIHAVKEAAKSVLEGLDRLDKLWPAHLVRRGNEPLCDAYQFTRTYVKGLAGDPGVDTCEVVAGRAMEANRHYSRAGYLKIMCVQQAIVLVRQFSKKKPVIANGGNVHQIAQLLFEAQPDGKRCFNTELLQAVRDVRWM